jgi:hypothetical protein
MLRQQSFNMTELRIGQESAQNTPYDENAVNSGMVLRDRPNLMLLDSFHVIGR